MNHTPNFYLTAAGEYAPLAEPRACWIKQRLRDAQGNDYLVAELRPPFSPVDAPSTNVSSVVLSARHQGESVAHIASWPIYVYVSRVPNDRVLETERFNMNQLEGIAWARLHPSIEDAIKDKERHAAALRSARSPETLYAPQVQFVGEQDGIPERALKEKLVRLFATDERVWKAYLARVDFGPGAATSVALCLRTVMGADSSLVARVGEVFAPLFGTRESLDILFIDDEQEHDLARVCKPFYVRVVSRHV